MKFIDEAQINVKAGDGGHGCLSFFRGPNLPKGGPDGGDGGRGGSVYIQASSNLHSLLDFKFQSRFEAERGRDGSGKQMNGRSGKDLILKLPLGTKVSDADGNVYHLVEESQKFCVARGGRGGLGNIHFKSSVRQAPRISTPGKTGEEKELQLELLSLCDIGLVGFPNAGKSSLLRCLSQAQPKVGDYPFTTLSPQLGVVESASPYTVADIPGLIEGAHENRGLGHRFLKHIERSQALVFVLSIDSEQSLSDQLRTLRHELSQYSSRLLDKPFLICVNKVDLLDSFPEKKTELEEFKDFYAPVLCVSAKQQTGLEPLKSALSDILLPFSESMVL